MRTHMERTRTAVLVAATLALGLAVTAALTVGTALPARAATGSRVTDSNDGFSVVLPQDWDQVSLSGSDIGAIIGDLTRLRLDSTNRRSAMRKPQRNKV